MHGSKQKIGATATSNTAPAALRRSKAKPTILLLVHEATRTGAPILAWNLIVRFRKKFDVVTILNGDGPLKAALEAVSTKTILLPDGPSNRQGEITRQLQEIVATYSPQYAIANSVATNREAVILADLDVPVVALVHEFSSDFLPVGCLHDLYLKASRIVFPTKIVAASSETDYFILGRRGYEIIPQGRTLPPGSDAKHAGSAALRSMMSSISKDTFIVAGAGTVTYRKGIDVFIAIAADLFRLNPQMNCKFIWVGHNFWFDAKYKSFLEQQIIRSGLKKRVVLMDEATDLGPLYQRADVFVLSSRLDPLPNVSIDAALKGKPVVCFENASGMAELLAEEKTTRSLVVPYQDTAGAAQIIDRLFKDPKYRTRISLSLKKKATNLFKIEHYIGSLQKLGQSCLDDRKQDARDLKVILKAGIFDAKLCFGDRMNGKSLSESIGRFLRESRIAMPSYRVGCDHFLRRPALGFNPLIYASDCRSFRSSNENPLAHFLRSGQPEGRWLHRVIVPPKREPRELPSHLRVALHGHFHYPELFPEFLHCLQLNRMKIDLFLTTTSKENAVAIRKVLADFGLKNADLKVTRNLGRDIGPFLANFRGSESNYDVIGHLHSKRSAHVAPEIGNGWRDFGNQHLLGGAYPMADIILQRFADEPELGLVFPEDPHLNGWDGNLELGTELARRMKITLPLPAYFDFPIGTTFWARPQALKPMFDLKLSDKDYPAEPVPIDGTILHALERLMAFSVIKAGYRYETTHAPGSRR